MFREVMDAIANGKNPDHKRIQKLSAQKQKAVKQAAQKAMRKRKGTHRDDGGDVIDTGMFR